MFIGLKQCGKSNQIALAVITQPLVPATSVPANYTILIAFLSFMCLLLVQSEGSSHFRTHLSNRGPVQVLNNECTLFDFNLVARGTGNAGDDAVAIFHSIPRW